MQRVTTILFTLLAAIPLLGCGTAEELQEQPAPPPRPATKEETSRMEFESTTDTVDVTRTGRPDSVNAPGHEPLIRFMVQIGAFRNAPLAAAVQTLARSRYRMPVLNDFAIKAGLYQIRIGFFETRGAAMAFRERMQKDFPEDYRDAWVVQLRR